MINQLTVMLYVKDVAATGAFWQEYLGFEILEEFNLGPSISLKLGNQKGFAIQLFDVDFIKLVSPEVSLETPSLMLHVADLVATQEKLQTSGFFVSPISEHGGQESFNFADNEGRYFACTQG